MRQWTLILGFVFWTVSAVGQSTTGASTSSAGFSLTGIGSAIVPVTLNKMTNIIFPEAVLTGVKVSRDVMAQKVRGVENVIELKAMRKGFAETNFSVYGKDGRLYSLVLRYSEDTVVLNYRVVVAGGGDPAVIQVSGLPANEVLLREDADELAARRFFLHRVRSCEGLRLRLGAAYVKDSLLWLVFAVRNSSPVGFEAVRWRFYMEYMRQVKRRAMQESAVMPVVEPFLAAVVPGRGFRRVAVAFRPFAVPAGRRLVVRLTGPDGREVDLRFRGKLIRKAHDTN